MALNKSRLKKLSPQNGRPLSPTGQLDACPLSDRPWEVDDTTCIIGEAFDAACKGHNTHPPISLKLKGLLRRIWCYRTY